MTPELIYMLKVNVGIALFYAFYKLFCCSDTFFRWRRIALLSFLALSFLYPLLNLQTWVKKQPAINELADYYALLIMPDGTSATGSTVTATGGILPTPTLLHLLTFVYLCGVLLLSIRFIIQLISIFRIVIKSKEETVEGIRVRALPSPGNPFSFWQWIFVYLPDLQESEKHEVLTHEQTHVRQWHSIDVIASEIVNIICWMNPFMWLLKGEIRLNLEYLADHTVINSITDTRQYQYHLLGLANQNRQTGLYNNFNVSHLKNRIIMMNKQRTRTTGRIKYALFAPLATALLLVSNIEAVARTAERIADEAANVATTVMQEAVPQAPPVETIDQDQDNQVFQVVEEAPEFPGGMTESLKYLAKNIKYPVSAQERGVQGKVIVSFIVEKDGSISGTKVVKSVDPDLDKEALRVIGLMPKWKPGKQKGQIVRVQFTVPVSFAMQGATPPAPAIPTGPNADGVYTVVENMPEFPGGMAACLEFIKNNIQYPADAKQKGIEGKTIIQMIIEKDGTPTHAKVVRTSENAELDAEALRVANSMPKWKPAVHKGEAVRVKYTIPITFKAQ